MRFEATPLMRQNLVTVFIGFHCMWLLPKNSKRNLAHWNFVCLQHPEGIWYDPSQREAMATYSLVDPRVRNIFHPSGFG